ncbi:U6 snRNA-associated Sm-like protein LSm2, partial [Nibea albiflora]
FSFYVFCLDCTGMISNIFLTSHFSACVFQYLNIKLTDISVTDPEKYPHMLSVKNCFIRGSVVRYVQLPADEVDTQLLQDCCTKRSDAAEAVISLRDGGGTGFSPGWDFCNNA